MYKLLREPKNEIEKTGNFWRISFFSGHRPANNKFRAKTREILLPPTSRIQAELPVKCKIHAYHIPVQTNTTEFWHAGINRMMERWFSSSNGCSSILNSLCLSGRAKCFFFCLLRHKIRVSAGHFIHYDSLLCTCMV
jgi:hypothetical protein